MKVCGIYVIISPRPQERRCCMVHIEIGYQTFGAAAKTSATQRMQGTVFGYLKFANPSDVEQLTRLPPASFYRYLTSPATAGLVPTVKEDPGPPSDLVGNVRRRGRSPIFICSLSSYDRHESAHPSKATDWTRSRMVLTVSLDGRQSGRQNERLSTLIFTGNCVRRLSKSESACSRHEDRFILRD
jgi:hypothetical protein